MIMINDSVPALDYRDLCPQDGPVHFAHHVASGTSFYFQRSWKNLVLNQ